ncbi:uncharacterized protein LOC117891009 [Drosophila subobscura]|uniref:uncharacterized protein LOC117891009 n=1 Tax=Drosophila subobscura TaxID=7241 RepID=UPI00155A87E9|nr:uncharacterized protein LOC117891009 [Drosophila subobscura]
MLHLLLFGLVLVSAHAHRSHRQVRYSPELMNELRDFTKLIPSATIDELVAEHLITDSGFRKAVKFLRSSDFKRLQQRTEALPEVVEIVNFVHLNDTVSRPKSRHWPIYSQRYRNRVQRRSVYNVQGARWDAEEEVILVLMPQGASYGGEAVGSFISFVRDLLTHLPRDRFVALISEKRQRSPLFGKFYEALRSAQFKIMVEAAMSSKNVASVIRELSDHDIDAQSLKAIGYEVISWGPA